MRALLVASLLCLSFACAEDEDSESIPSIENPATGTLLGEPWTFISGYTDGFLSADSDSWFAILTEWDSNCETDDFGGYVTVRLPKMVGTFTDGPGPEGTFQRDTEGGSKSEFAQAEELAVDRIEDGFVYGSIKMTRGEETVEGNFVLKICPEES